MRTDKFIQQVKNLIAEYSEQNGVVIEQLTVYTKATVSTSGRYKILDYDIEIKIKD